MCFIFKFVSIYDLLFFLVFLKFYYFISVVLFVYSLLSTFLRKRISAIMFFFLFVFPTFFFEIQRLKIKYQTLISEFQTLFFEFKL